MKGWHTQVTGIHKMQVNLEDGGVIAAIVEAVSESSLVGEFNLHNNPVLQRWLDVEFQCPQKISAGRHSLIARHQRTSILALSTGDDPRLIVGLWQLIPKLILPNKVEPEISGDRSERHGRL